MKAQKLTKETVLDLGIVDRKFPKFGVGDKVELSQLVTEGGKERVQKFEGDVIAFHRNGISSTFTLRRIASGGIGVERIYPLYSPVIKDIKYLGSAKIRRAKLFFMRKRIGKAASLEIKRNSKN